jgi:hypothetical protein
LERLGYEILEHKGGDYDHDLMFECRYMVMVGQNSAFGGSTLVGKGQYNQLKLRRDRSTNYYHLYFTGTNDDGKPMFRGVTTDGIVDATNWTTGYGKLRIKSANRCLRDISGDGPRPRPIPEPDRSQIDGGQDMMKQADRIVVVQGEPAHYDEGVGNDGQVFVKDGVHVSDNKIHLACITLFN